MTEIRWGIVRRELQSAIEAVQYEVEGEEGHFSERVVMTATDHVRTALLLMTGTSAANIIGHSRGARHDA